MMMRTIRLRDGSVIRVALWRDAESGRIALALEADLGWAPALPERIEAPPVGTAPAHIAGSAPRLVLRPPRAKPASLANTARREGSVAPRLSLAAPTTAVPRPNVHRTPPWHLPRPDARRSTPLAATIAALQTPAAAPLTFRLPASRDEAAARALHPESKSLAAPMPRDPAPTGYEAAFLLGPIAG